MAYEPKPGSLSLFKNDRKEKDTHADYRGDGLLPDGTPVWISAWVKGGAKGKFFSISLQLKDQGSQGGRSGGGADRGGQSSMAGRGGNRQESFAADIDVEIPF